MLNDVSHEVVEDFCYIPHNCLRWKENSIVSHLQTYILLGRLLCKTISNDF